MKISVQEVDRIIRTRSVAAPTRLTRIDLSEKPVKTHGQSAEASVEISSRAQEIQQAKKAVDALPDVREELVEALKARIESGDYQVSGEEIADLMIRRAYADRIR